MGSVGRRLGDGTVTTWPNAHPLRRATLLTRPVARRSPAPAQAAIEVTY